MPAVFGSSSISLECSLDLVLPPSTTVFWLSVMELKEQLIITSSRTLGDHLGVIVVTSRWSGMEMEMDNAVSRMMHHSPCDLIY